MEHIFRASKKVDNAELVLTIWPDYDAELPRGECDRVVIWAKDTHRRHNFHEEASETVLDRIKSRMPIPDDREDEPSQIWWLYKNQTPTSSYCIQPLFMYDHSGLRFSTAPFSCGWDSGQIGWVMTDATLWSTEMGLKWDTERVNVGITEDVSILDDFYVYGAYGFTTEKKALCQCCGQTIDDDSREDCGGFYGPITNTSLIKGVETECGAREQIKDYLPEEFKDLLEGWN